MRMRRIAEQIYVEMPQADKAAMEAYARGVNAYIESHRGRYGVEFTLIGYDPRPWSVVDSLLCGLQMFRTLTSDWRNKLIKQQMLRSGEPDKVNFLFPYRTGAEFMPAADAHPVRTPGRFREHIPQRENRCCRAICISNSAFLASGIWNIWKRPA